MLQHKGIALLLIAQITVSAQQCEAPTIATITKRSPVSERVNLFLSLFQGRPDVYARRGESKNGRSGYSPFPLDFFGSPLDLSAGATCSRWPSVAEVARFSVSNCSGSLSTLGGEREEPLGCSALLNTRTLYFRFIRHCGCIPSLS